MIEAVIFDCDGLLVDTETPWYEAFCDIYRAHGAELPLEKYVQCVGTDFQHFDPYEYLEECTGKAFDRTELARTLASKHQERMEKEMLRPGVTNYLQEAKRLGLKIGLASSSDREWVSHHTRRYGIDRYFDVMCTADDVKKVKPDPALYQLACTKLAVEPNKAIAFEDSANGLEAARRAGLRTVVIPNDMTRHLDFGPYDRMLQSMEEIDLPSLIASL